MPTRYGVAVRVRRPLRRGRGSWNVSAATTRRRRCPSLRRRGGRPSNESGVTHRATGRWWLVGRRYCPIVTMSTPTAAQIREGVNDLVVGLPHSDDESRLRDEIRLLGPSKHGQAARVARRRPHCPLQPRDGLDVVVQHLGTSREDHVQRFRIALAVRDEHLDRDTWALRAGSTRSFGRTRQRPRPASRRGRRP